MKKIWFNDLKNLNLHKFAQKDKSFSKKYAHSKQLNIRGVGYKSWTNADKRNINFDLGLTHYVSVLMPDKIGVISKKTKMIISSVSKQDIGIFSNIIKNIKSPDIYKGKGIRFDNEIVKLKVGKVKN